MAAVATSTPPLAAPASPTSSRHPPPPLQTGSPERRTWSRVSEGATLKALPPMPTLDSPRLRGSPVSPVRVNFQPEAWAQPSSASIERASQAFDDHTGLSEGSYERDLPKTPDAPPPPPHSPMYVQVHKQAPAQQNPAASALGRKPLPPTLELPHRPAQTQHLSPTSIALGSTSTKLDGVASPDRENMSLKDSSIQDDPNRHSRETDTTESTQQQTSTKTSATSASSVSEVNDGCDGQETATDASPEDSSILETGNVASQSVPQLQYHHQSLLPRSPTTPLDSRNASTPDLIEAGRNINRHLTPNSFYGRRTSMPRPQSSYSLGSDFGPRGRSPAYSPGNHARVPSAHRKSPDNRNSTYAELLNVPYPQPAPAPITFDNSHLRNNVGANASLLSAQKTLDMYRQNVKKTNDFSIQYSFAVFLIATAQEQGLSFDDSTKRQKSPKPPRDLDSPYVDNPASTPHDLVREAKGILTRLANGGFPFAQYYLADGYASGLFNKGKEDYNAAFPLFVLAAKHGHAESAYRAGLCYEFGWGCRKDPAKAVQYLRTAASKGHPGAMTRLGQACLSGDLGDVRYREGIKWMKRAAEAADAIYNSAPYLLGCLYETGYGEDVFKDESYAAELFTQAAELGHAEANYRMGEAYEHGKLNCPRDPALSVHFYTGAAERGHAAAMMGLCAWYMVGALPILEKDEEEAYEWARRSAELGYTKAEYAVGYFTEMGIGCRRDILEANVWYVKAADSGDERAKQRLAAIRAAVSGQGTPMEVAPAKNPRLAKKNNAAGSGKDKDENCAVM